MKKWEGRAWVFGDNIDTDLIVPSKYLTERDPQVMARGTFENVRPEFAKQVKPGDVIVAGGNFGCGSSREEAPFAIQTLGIRLVAARSFARIFFRNAINLGLPAVEVSLAPGSIQDGDAVEVDLTGGMLRNLRSGTAFNFEPLPPFLQAILDAGGALKWLQAK